MKTEYCHYPPQIASDVEVSEQRDGGHPAFTVGSAATGRYILLRATEHNVQRLLGQSLSPNAVCDEFKRQYGGTLSLPTLTSFLTRLDEVGLLAGERAQRVTAPELQLGTQFYLRFHLFDPDRLFTRMVTRLRWIWTPEFVVSTLCLMLTAVLLSLLNWAEMTNYSFYAIREHYVAILIAGLFVGLSHEFAHGLTCKAFGGRVPEVGVLLIYYFLPGLYCNVSGIHLIPQPNRRLWVIAAGVYWQVLVGTLALLVWFLFAPYSLPAEIAFILFLGSVLDVVFNANPLIKLDGYYFLSQWLRLPNLMDRSRVYWRGLLRRWLFGEPTADAERWSKRERAIYAAFGLLSFVYTVGLRVLIVCYAGSYLIDWFHLPGLLVTAGLALFYARRFLRELISAAVSMMTRVSDTFLKLRAEDGMANSDQTTSAAMTMSKGATKGTVWRRRLVPVIVFSLFVVVLLLPWNASVGNYGALIAIPGQEEIIRAPENATLIALRTQPGEQIASGAVVGRMGSLELEEQIVQVQSDLARASADHDRLFGELRTREESVTRADSQLRQRQQDLDEIAAERQQIAARRGADSGARTVQFTTISTTVPPTLDDQTDQLTDQPADQRAARYPAALAVLQADVDLRRAQLDEATLRRERGRHLHAEGIMPRSELDAAETRATMLTIELAGARDRLAAALIEHRRKHTSIATEMNLARSDTRVAALQVEKFGTELRAMSVIMSTLAARRDLLQRKQAQFELVTSRGGTVFGEELPRLVGHYFQKGAAICRVADNRQLLLRLNVPENEIGDVRVGHPVRLRTRSFPDREFRGVVSKIGGESEQAEHQQATYRVELTIENNDGLLRPGMTAFARIDFGREMIGQILLHKLKQALRPELWML